MDLIRISLSIAHYFNISNLCENCLQANPGFVGQENGDYHLSASSAAINQAISIPGINTIDNNGNASDIGALEF